MHARLAVVLVALGLAGCEGGHRADPGGDNLHAGPSLRISSPSPDQVLTVHDPVVMFDASAVSFGDSGNSIAVVVDEGPATTWPDATRPYPLGPLDPGAHLVRAFVVAEDGRAYQNPDAFVAIRFHVDRAQLDAFDPKAPMVTVAVPGPEVRRGAGPAVANVFLSGTPAGAGHRLRVTLTGTGMPPLVSEKSDGREVVVLSERPPGKHVILAEVLGADGKPLTGPMARVERSVEVR